MSIHLTPEQERLIQQAIQSGLVSSVDEFIDSALGALAGDRYSFDKEKAKRAGEQIRELRKGIRFDLRGLSFRKLAHEGHKY